MSKEYKKKLKDITNKYNEVTPELLTVAFGFEIGATKSFAKFNNFQKREKDEIDLIEKILMRALLLEGKITNEDFENFDKKIEALRVKKRKTDFQAGIKRTITNARKAGKPKKKSKKITAGQHQTDQQ